MNTTRRWWPLLILLSAALLALDYLTGPYIQFPITFALPVSLAVWYLGRWTGIGFGVVLTSLRFIFELVWTSPTFTPAIGAANAGIHLIAFVGLAWIVAQLAAQSRELARRVTTLEGLLPICCFCKKIRRDDGAWEPVETYVAERSAAKFTHGFCTGCARQHYPEVFGENDSTA